MGKLRASDVTLIIPTRSRKERLGGLIDNLKHPHELTVIVVDEGRETEDLPANLNGHCVVRCSPDSGSVKAMEAGILACKTSHFIALNDDVSLAPDCIENAINYHNERFEESDGVVGFNHGERFAGIGCFALIPKKFYMKHCYPSPYKRYCLDNEWTDKAKRLGIYGKCHSAVIRHDFPDKDEQTQNEDWHTLINRVQQFNSDHQPIQKLFIGIPIYGAVDIHFFDSMMKFIEQRKGFNCVVHFQYGDSLVSRARNSIVMEFLKTDCTHLLMIDSDLVFSIEQIKRLFSHGEDVVGGLYPKKKQGEVEFVFNCLTPPEQMDSRRLTLVKYVGTGFLCVSRKVFEKIISEYGDELIFKVDGKEGKIGFDFFKVGVYKYPDGNRRYLSEDWYFCQMATDLGFKIYADNGILLKHSGGAVYPLQSQETQIFGKPEKVKADNAVAASSPEMAAA